MVRIKFAAILIGPIGVGFLGIYLAIQSMVGTVAGLGIQSSAVRNVAEAVGQGDQAAIGRAVLTLRRLCWITGLIGALMLAALAAPISQWTFGSSEHVFDITLLGAVILFSNIQGGQMALIQGMRRITDLAKINVISALAGTLTSIVFYIWLGLQGIIPALVLMAFVQLIVSWFFARRIPVPPVKMRWIESLHSAGGMVRLGLAFMWSGLLVAAVAYLTRTLINHDLGVEAVGIFTAAFALSGIFINVVLSAMGADYYPRLTAANSNHIAMARLVNEQTEIGLLLAVPGLLATLSLAHWIIYIFYTEEFLSATNLLQWFVVGCLGRVLSWPLGFVMLALGKGTWFFFTETVYNLFHLALVWFGLKIIGLEGVAVAFFVMYLFYIIAVYAVSRHLIGFSWSPSTWRLFLMFLPIVVMSFIGARLLPIWPATALGLSVTLIATIFSLRGFVERIGAEHRVVRKACQIPGMRWACGL